MVQKNMDHKVGRLIIVDDEAELMTALSEMLAGQGYETTGVTMGTEALEILKEQDYDLLLTDMMMPEMNGIELLRRALAIDPDIVGIIMTGQGTVQTAVEAMKIGAFDYIMKPFKMNTLLPVLSRAMEVRQLRMENMQLRETVAMHELGKAIAYSYDLNSILNKVADAALQQCNADEVSIMLPSQDGKELQIAAIRGRSMEYLGERISIDQGIAGWVAQNREPVTLHGEVDDQRFTPIKPRANIRAALSMPMLAGGNLVGVLNVNITESRRPFTLGQVKTLGILVNIVSPILENTSLYNQVRQAEEKYRSIFENAVEGIYQSTHEGAYVTVNPAFARMFGYASPQEMMDEVSDIQKQNYIDPEDRSRMQQIVEREGSAKGLEIQYRRKDGSHFWGSINSRVVRNGKGNIQYYEGTIEDITHRKKAEMHQRLVNEILEALNRPNEIINLIRDILLLLKEHMDIEGVGIRLREGDDFPYYIANGFPLHFLEAEKFLCARDDANNIIRDSQGNPYLECMCGNVICGRTDPLLPFFTEGGSFWTNCTTKLLASALEENGKVRMRNRCSSEGYESVALIPLRSGDQIIGLLQLNDTRGNRFTIDMIQFLEGIGASIGIAVARQLAVKTIKENEEKYRLHFENVSDVICSIDAEFKILSISPSVKKMLGYKPEELIGRSIPELNIMTPDGLKTAYSDIKRMLAGERMDSSVYEFVARDEVKRFVEVKAVPLIYNGKSPAPVVIVVARDITERRQAEEWLLRERSMVDRIMKTSPASIVVVDRKGKIVFVNKRAEKIFDLPVDKIIGLAYDAPEWRITDFDGNPFPHERLPFVQVVASGNVVYGVRHTITLSDGRLIYFSINGAPIFDDQGIISEVVLIIDDISEQKHAEEKITLAIEQLRQSFEGTIRVTAMTIEARDPYTAGHQRRVADLAQAIARKMELSIEQVNGVRVGAMTHDIGKISVPAEILSKPTKLSDIEFRLIKVHAQSGYDILKDIAFPWPIARMVLEHHERVDGSGYPNGLKGTGLLMESRILSVADVVEAIASHRPYRPALGVDAALEEIDRNKGVLYDTDVVNACLMLFRDEKYQLPDISV